jgi:mannose-1-phosphate guanylyltransferase
MNAVILAAGKGTRLGAITETTPKPLLEIRGVPILQHTVERCVRDGIDTLFVNTHHLADRVRALLGDGARFGARIRYSFEPDLLGTAGALANFRPWLEDEDFFVIYGDNYFDYDLSAIARFHREKGGVATIALYEIEDVSHSGIAVVDADARIHRFIEKPKPEEVVSHLVNCGIYVLSPRIFRFIPAGVSDFGKDVFPALLAAGEAVYGMPHDGGLIPVDTVSMLQRARRS